MSIWPSSGMRLLTYGLLPCVGLLGAAAQAFAADYPTRSITIVVPATPGGSLDGAIRVMADQIREKLGQPVIIENRPGANGLIGIRAVVQAKPDGYTLLANGSGFNVGPLILKSFTFNPIDELSHIVAVAAVPTYITTSSKTPFKTAQEFAAYAKANPGQLNWGISPSLSAQMDTTLLLGSLGLNVKTINYAGSNDTVTALLRGDIQISSSSFPPIRGHVEKGALRIVAVNSSTRSTLTPNVPSFTEAIPAAVPPPLQSVGLSGPKNLPDHVIETVNAAVNAVLKEAAVKERFATFGLEPMGGKAEVWTKAQQDVFNHYKRAAEMLKIEPQ